MTTRSSTDLRPSRTRPLRLWAARALGLACAGALASLGCTDGVLQEPDGSPPSLTLTLHFTSAPAADTASLYARLSPIAYCPWSDVLHPNTYPSVLQTPWPVAPAHLSASQEDTRVTLKSDGDPRSFRCQTQGFPLVRFLEVRATTAPPSDLRSAWEYWEARDTLIAWAEEPAYITAYGPDDPPLWLPAGYSRLRRICVGGTERPWRWEPASMEAPVDLSPDSRNEQVEVTQSLPAALEAHERALLGLCGALPPRDLVTEAQLTRVSFDRAQSVALSQDGDEILYLPPIDSAEPSGAASLRSITVGAAGAAGAVTELARIVGGRAVQRTTGPSTFVGTTAQTLQVTGHGVTPLPVSPVGRLSPDARWIAADDVIGGGVAVWDVAAGMARPSCPGMAEVGWSPASLLTADEITPTGIAALLWVDPETCQIVQRFPNLIGGQGGYLRVVSTPQSPILLSSMLGWRPQQPVARLGLAANDDPGFGLQLDDFSDGRQTRAIDPMAGRLTFAAAGGGAAFVWAKKCLGLFETVCSYTLHRVALPSGADQIVAVMDASADTPGLVAVSASGNRLVIANGAGIFVRDLPGP
jgi:hypothetical protein